MSDYFIEEGKEVTSGANVVIQQDRATLGNNNNRVQDASYGERASLQHGNGGLSGNNSNL